MSEITKDDSHVIIITPKLRAWLQKVRRDTGLQPQYAIQAYLEQRADKIIAACAPEKPVKRKKKEVVRG